MPPYAFCFDVLVVPEAYFSESVLRLNRMSVCPYLCTSDVKADCASVAPPHPIAGGPSAQRVSP